MTDNMRPGKSGRDGQNEYAFPRRKYNLIIMGSGVIFFLLFIIGSSIFLIINKDYTPLMMVPVLLILPLSILHLALYNRSVYTIGSAHIKYESVLAKDKTVFWNDISDIQYIQSNEGWEIKLVDYKNTKITIENDIPDIQKLFALIKYNLEFHGKGHLLRDCFK